MTGDQIREVEDDPREGVVVTIEEDAVDVAIPAPCAGCLGEATKRLPSVGVNWLEFPYCDTCVPPRRGEPAPERAKRKPPLFSGLFARIFLGPLIPTIAEDVGGPRGNAVKLLLSAGGTVRLGFKNREYARLFVEANGARMPEE